MNTGYVKIFIIGQQSSGYSVYGESIEQTNSLDHLSYHGNIDDAKRVAHSYGNANCCPVIDLTEKENDHESIKA